MEREFIPTSVSMAGRRNTNCFTVKMKVGAGLMLLNMSIKINWSALADGITCWSVSVSNVSQCQCH